MPIYKDHSKHCVDCKAYREKTCEIREKASSISFRSALDLFLFSQFKTITYHTNYWIISCCDKFEPYQKETMLDAVMRKLKEDIPLTEEEKAFVEKVLG